jgi:hypothetical protein
MELAFQASEPRIAPALGAHWSAELRVRADPNVRWLPSVSAGDVSAGLSLWEDDSQTPESIRSMISFQEAGSDWIDFFQQLMGMACWRIQLSPMERILNRDSS